MNTLMLLRNLIQCNSFLARSFNLLGALPFYRVLIERQMQKRLQILQKTHAVRLMLELCSICNAHCSFCPYPELGRPLQRMPDEIFEKIIVRLKEENITPPSFELHMMGEPLLDPDIFKRAARLREEFPKTRIAITSNFNSVSESIIKDLLDSQVNCLNISLNAATPETYHQLMGLDYQRTINNINRLLELRAQREQEGRKGLWIQLSYVICAANQKEKWKFWRQWASRVDSLRMQVASPWTKKLPLLPHRWWGKRNHYPCADLFTKMPIFSNGDYALCCQDATGMVHLNVQDTKIWDAFNSATFQRIREGQLSGKWISKCENCTLINDSNGANWFIT